MTTPKAAYIRNVWRQLGISCTDNCNCEKNDVPCRNIKEIVTTADDHETGEDDIDNDIEMNNVIIDISGEFYSVQWEMNHSIFTMTVNVNLIQISKVQSQIIVL